MRKCLKGQMRKEWISDEDYFKIEGHGKEMGAMLKGLINSISKS